MNYINRLKISLIESFTNFIDLLPKLVIALFIIIIGFYLTKKIMQILNIAIFKKAKDPLIANFISQIIKLTILMLFFLLALDVAGFGKIASGIFAAAGASAVILGFAFKDIGENFIAGVILSFNRPFKIDDTVLIGDVFGKVQNMELRVTQIKTFDGIDIYIPNSEIIKKPVANYTEDGYFRLDLTFIFPIIIDIHQTENDILNTIRKNTNIFEDTSHELFSTITQITTDNYNIKVYFWIKTKEYRKHYHIIKSNIIDSVRKMLVEKNIPLIQASK